MRETRAKKRHFRVGGRGVRENDKRANVSPGGGRKVIGQKQRR